MPNPPATTVTGAFFVDDTLTLRYGDDIMETYPLTPPFVAELARVLEPGEWLLVQVAAQVPGRWVEVGAKGEGA